MVATERNFNFTAAESLCVCSHMCLHVHVCIHMYTRTHSHMCTQAPTCTGTQKHLGTGFPASTFHPFLVPRQLWAFLHVGCGPRWSVVMASTEAITAPLWPVPAPPTQDTSQNSSQASGFSTGPCLGCPFTGHWAPASLLYLIQAHLG